MKETCRINSQKGSALVGAMLVSLLMTVLTVAVLMRAESLGINSKYPRMKGAMSSMETRLKLAAMSSSSYACLGSTFSTCIVKLSVLNDIATSFSRQVCSAEALAAPIPTCGFRVINGGIDNNRNFSATIRLLNGKSNLRDLRVQFQIPVDFLFDADKTECPPSQPLYIGINADGSKKCVQLNPSCPAGQYVKSVDQKNFSIVCQELKPAPPVTCGTDEMIGDFSWTGVNGAGVPTFTHTCISRLSPFPYFDNSASITQNIVPPVPDPGYPANNTPDNVPGNVGTSCSFTYPATNCTPPAPAAVYYY